MYKWVLFALLVGAFAGGMTLVFVQADKHATEFKQAPVVAADVPLDEPAATAIFKANCVACHGVDLEGGAGPNLTKVGTKMSQVQIAAQINNGKGNMPPFNKILKPAEVTNLAKWLNAKK